MAVSNRTLSLDVRPLANEDGRCVIYWGDGGRDICNVEQTYTHVYENVSAGTEYDVNVVGAAEFALSYMDGFSHPRVEMLQQCLTSMPEGMLSGCEIAFDTLPDSLSSIGSEAFRDCRGLANLTLPDGLHDIGDLVFDHCTSLSNITMDGELSSIGVSALSRCDSLESVVFLGKTIEQVEAMENYPWGITDTSVIRVEQAS